LLREKKIKKLLQVVLKFLHAIVPIDFFGFHQYTAPQREESGLLFFSASLEGIETNL